MTPRLNRENAMWERLLNPVGAEGSVPSTQTSITVVRAIRTPSDSVFRSGGTLSNVAGHGVFRTQGAMPGKGSVSTAIQTTAGECNSGGMWIPTSFSST